MKERRASGHTSLSMTITRYYLSFFMLILLCIFASAALVRGVAMLFTGGFSEFQLEASLIVRADYTKIDIQDITRYGGWVEILQGSKVIYVLGKKQDDQYDYGSKDIMGLGNQNGMLQLSANFIDSTYFYSSSMFRGKDGNTYMCLVKIPKQNVQKEFNWFFNASNPRINQARLILLTLFGVVVSFSVFFGLCVAFYSRITSKKISKPLDAIANGLSRITNGDLSVRIGFEAEQEFAQIRDAFNYMAERLQAAERDKQAMEEDKKKLIMGISHDLKTPITTVYGYAKALSDGMVTDPAKQQKHLKYICDKSQTMTKLIDDLFNYSLLEGGGYALKRRKEDFAEFLRELIANNYIDIENKGMELELDIPETAVPFLFDPEEMGRALTNIIGNSVKYNPSGTALSVRMSAADGALKVIIEDNGIGIAEDLRSAVFSEFVRGDAARPSDGGSGLGLAIARRVIEMHGGSISLESGEGKGSRFVITLPY
jgi:signal transduction histidine kinase